MTPMRDRTTMTDGLSTRRKALATAGVTLALLLASLDQSIVGTALPRIVAELHGLTFYSWVVTAYIVSSAVMTPIAGKLGDLFGRKPFVLAGMLGFLAASWLCGLSQTMLMLTLLRAVQGVFGGILTASVFAVVADIFPPAQLAKTQGIFGGVFGFSVLVGPTAGGWITDHLGWRWVFYVNLPVGVIGLLLVLAFLPSVRSSATWRDIDLLGSVTLAAGVVPLLVALSLTATHAWLSPPVLGLLALAVVLLATFAVIERRAAQPVVPFALFRHNAVWVSLTVAFFAAVAQFGAGIYIPLLYQKVLGVSATNSGTLLTPMLLAMLVTGLPAGWVMVRLRHYRFLNTVGLALVIGGLVLLATITPSSGRWEVVRDIVVVGMGLGLLFPLATAVVQVALPRQVVGVATGQVQFWRLLGGAMGTAVLGALLTGRLNAAAQRHIPAPLALSAALHTVFLTVAAVLVIALVASVFLREVPLRGRPGAGEQAASTDNDPERRTVRQEAAG